MPSLRRNILANFVGRFWTVALGLVFPPIYARMLGIESYGLVGVWTSLNALLSVLDLGLSTTLNRELARYSAGDDDSSHREMRDVTRTIEWVFVAIGVLAGALIVVLAPVISHGWVNRVHLSSQTVSTSVRLMGAMFALQWPLGMYNGSLLALQKQVAANVLQVVFSAVRVLGSAFIIWKISSTIQAFFLWQLISTAGQVVATRATLRRSLPGLAVSERFRWNLLVRNWRFSGGMFVISIFAMVLTQADKIIVSKLLSLEQFGYYTLAWAVGGSLANMVQPIFIAVFPRLTQLVQQKNVDELRQAYHLCCQLLSAAVMPVAAVLAVFSGPVLFAWSGDLRLVSVASSVLSIVVVGTALHGLMHLPYALQLAFGWTRLTAVANMVSAVMIVPLEYLLTKRYGSVGAAAGWVILNSAYVLILVPVMHSRFLRGEQWRWYLRDVGGPLLGSLAIVLPLRAVISPPSGRLAIVAFLLATGIAAALGAVATAPALRSRGIAILDRLWALRHANES